MKQLKDKGIICILIDILSLCFSCLLSILWSSYSCWFKVACTASHQQNQNFPFQTGVYHLLSKQGMGNSVLWVEDSTRRKRWRWKTSACNLAGLYVTLWGQIPTPTPSTCLLLVKKAPKASPEFQRINLIREVRKCRKKANSQDITLAIK